jgi:protein-disulfide isomerase
MKTLLAALVVLVASAAHAQNPQSNFTPEQQAELEAMMEKKVETYIAAHPEALVASLEAHEKQQAQLAAQPTNEDVVLGDDNAPVTLIEYASLSCGHCAKFSNDVFPELKTKYIDTGKVKFILRDFPLNASALHGSILARCAGKDKYYDVVHTLFAEQEKWAFDQDFMSDLAAYGKQYGVTQEQFDTCIADKQLQEKIMARMQDGSEKFAINSTPSFVLNGEKTESLNSVARLTKALDAALGENKP